ncbi:MAG TPA: methylcobamide--CoM methyltransferase [Thermodesulfobacteriota bacterium]|nr:methylcobamide--CoM methyltransferase [Thermodesulfobacteriota bacterium]
MELILTSAGSYPRVGVSEGQQILRRTIAEREKGEKSDHDLRIAENEMTRMAIMEQVDAGLDLVTDGLVRWYDPVSHIAGQLKGVEINGLLRYFDTNFYFRQPVVKEKLEWTKPIIVDELVYAKSISPKPVKPVLTGPYTLARLSIADSDSYMRLDKLVEDFTDALAQEIRELSRSNADIIQVDEPAIIKYPEDYGIIKEAIVVLNRAKEDSKLALYTYSGDISPLYGKFQDLPVDVLGIDFTYGTNLVEIVSREGSEKPLGLGLIDGRNTKLESRKKIMNILDRVLPRIKGGISYLNPSCGLEYLPRDKAFEKLKNMSEIKKNFCRY